MSDLVLKQLLKEYEKKRFIADTNFEYKKASLYRDCPKLEDINSKLNNYALMLSKTKKREGKYNSKFKFT